MTGDFSWRPDPDSGISVDRVEANGLRFEVAQAGEGDHLALCLHGFPELHFSWRSQMPLLAEMGYRVWAPNLRGYGATTRPEGVRNYALDHLTRDVAALIDASGAKKVTLIAHDWGALIAWTFAIMRLRPLERLIGSVRKQGDRVRVTAQLIKADDGFHLWSQTFDRNLDDIFAVQDEISAAVADALSITLKSGALPARQADIDPQAYDLYLRARQLFATRNLAAIYQAIDLFRAALVIEPDFADALSGKGHVLATLLYFEYYAKVNPLIAEAEAAANRALELSPDNAEAYITLAQINSFYHRDWAAADAAMKKAIALAPNEAELANFAGDHFRYRSDFYEAEKWERLAIERNPLHAINHSDLAVILIHQRRYEEAREAALRAVELDPDMVQGWAQLGGANIELGEFERAQNAIDKLRTIPDGRGFVVANTIALEVAKNDSASLREELDEIENLSSPDSALQWPRIYGNIALGEFEKAAAAIEIAYSARDPDLVLYGKYLIPEDWPDDPAIRRALDKPELNALYEIRKRNLQNYPRRELN